MKIQLFWLMINQEFTATFLSLHSMWGGHRTMRNLTLTIKASPVYLPRVMRALCLSCSFFPRIFTSKSSGTRMAELLSNHPISTQQNSFSLNLRGNLREHWHHLSVDKMSQVDKKIYPCCTVKFSGRALSFIVTSLHHYRYHLSD